MKRLLRLLFVLVVIGALCAFAVILLFGGRSATFPPLPNPNGYDDLVKAGNLISDSTNRPYDMEGDGLRAYLLTNAESLRLGRLGLSRTCSVPTAEAITNFSGPMSDLMAVKDLAWLLDGEGRLAEMEGRTNAAADCYVDCIRLGNESSRGGFLIHRLVGIACTAIGCQGLARLAPALHCEEGKPVIAELERVDKATVSWEEVSRCERAYMRHEMRQEINPIKWIQAWWQSRSLFQNVKQKHNRTIARVRLLATELALRCYQSEHGRIADQLDALVPKYLRQIPQDPFSGQPLVYRIQGTNWELYIIGPQQANNDRAVSWEAAIIGKDPQGKIFFDSR